MDSLRPTQSCIPRLCHCNQHVKVPTFSQEHAMPKSCSCCSTLVFHCASMNAGSDGLTGATGRDGQIDPTGPAGKISNSPKAMGTLGPTCLPAFCMHAISKLSIVKEHCLLTIVHRCVPATHPARGLQMGEWDWVAGMLTMSFHMTPQGLWA